MKQIIQFFETGELTVADVPTPVLRLHGILVRNASSLVSAGTKHMVIDFVKKNLLDKTQREGIFSTVESACNHLKQPLPLGYDTAGVVVGVGSEATGFAVGDRVACVGDSNASS